MTNGKNILSVVAITACFFSFQTSGVQAQGNINVGTNTTHISLDDKYPEPGQVVTATIKQFNPETAQSPLKWYINNSHQSAVNDLREIETIAPALGETVLLQAKHEGEVVAETSFTPTYVDIIVDPDTYVPPQFKARPLPTANSYVTFTAIVEEANKLPAGSYSYEWKKNGRSVKGRYVSGSQINIPVENARNHTISVKVTHPDRGVVGQKFIQIPIANPQAYFYEIHTLYGKSPNSLDSSTKLNGNQLQLQVVPYYFNNEVLRNNPDIFWERDDQVIQNGGDVITLQKNSQQGRTVLEFNIEGRDIMDQRLRENILIRY